MIREAPKHVRVYLNHAVITTATSVAQRMRARVAVDEGELKGAIDTKLPKSKTSLHAQAGVFAPEEEVAVAMFNEYIPNKQPFMRAAAQDEASGFKDRAQRALKQAEDALTRGGL